MLSVSESPSITTAEPIVFGGLFGWFSPGTTRRGVILCGASGFEQLSAHRPWRQLADQIAALGCATLRFDYPGEGNSTDVGATSLTTWINAIHHAVRFLREVVGVEEVVLVGLRLGATLAVLAALETSVDRLALLAPCSTGRGYLREMKLRERAINGLPDGTALTQDLGHLSIGGFSIKPDFAEELAAIDIRSVATLPAPRILILGAETGTLATRYAALGADVTSGALPGLAQLIGNPLFAVAPNMAYERVVSFVSEGAEPRAFRVAPLVASTHLSEAGWCEEAVRFGPNLFGVQTKPKSAATGVPTVLFIAAGLSVHSGWGRQATRIARTLAVSGVPSLRVDLAGIGDSPDRPDGTSPIFAVDAWHDLRHAIDHLDAQGAGPVVLLGMCSGAYAAFHAAYHDDRVAGVVLANLPCFDWHPDNDLDAYLHRTIGDASTYAALLARGTTWRRLITGQINVRTIGRVLASRAFQSIRRRWKDLFRAKPLGGSVPRRIAAMRRRGMQLRLIYTAGDPGLALLRSQLGRLPRWIERRLGAPVRILAGTDHNFSTLEAQARLSENVREIITGIGTQKFLSSAKRALR